MQTAAVRIAGLGLRMTRVEDRAVAALQHPQQRGLACAAACPLDSISRHSAGVTVSATSIETSTARP